MRKIIFGKSIPKSKREKSVKLIKNFESIQSGKKKISSLRDCLSIKLDSNYRILSFQFSTENRVYYVLNHDDYIKKIKNIKNQKVCHGNSL